MFPLVQNFVFAQDEIAAKGNLRIVAEPGINELYERYIHQNKSHPETEGYRIQVYNGRKTDCMNVSSRFISTVPNTAIYWLYEAPEYKIQAGDFRTRLEAEKFLQQVQKEFSGIFVVKTKIKFPKLSRSEDSQ